MKLTQKLLGLLHRVFDPDPEQFLALQIRHDAGLTWSIMDARLTTNLPGEEDAGLDLDLTQFTLRELINYIAAQPGYTVVSSATSEQRSLSARVLIDGSGNIASSNGDHLYGYTSLTWVYLEPVAVELRAAKAQIPQALNQMAVTTASDDWLDELGNFYGVKRQQGELDPSYGSRIIAEVVRPRSNNIAMEKAISYYTGQATKVADVVVYGDPFPLYNSLITRNSEYNYEALAQPQYGLFDVQYGYDLLGGTDQSGFAMRVRSIIEKIRAAGTHLRTLSLQSAVVTDALTPPTDDDPLLLNVAPSLIDSLDAPSDNEFTFGTSTSMSDIADAGVDALGLIVLTNYRYNAIRRYDGRIIHRGVTPTAENVGSAGDIPFSLLTVMDGGAVMDGSLKANGLVS